MITNDAYKLLKAVKKCPLNVNASNQSDEFYELFLELSQNRLVKNPAINSNGLWKEDSVLSISRKGIQYLEELKHQKRMEFYSVIFKLYLDIIAIIISIIALIFSIMK